MKRIFIIFCFTVTILVIESPGGLREKIGVGKSLEETLDGRGRTIKDVCQHNKNQLEWPERMFKRNLKNHVWDFTHGLVYCPIAKVASTTWFLNFFEILDINIQGLHSLKESRTVNGTTSFLKKGTRGKIAKIKIRNIIRNITAPGKWNFKELARVWSYQHLF